MQAMDANRGPFVLSQPTAPDPSQTQSPQEFIVTSPYSSPIPTSKTIPSIIFAMGGSQLILGILEIALNIGEHTTLASLTNYVGPGYWCGVPAIITGCFGMVAGKTNGSWAIITFLVMSIFTCVITIGIFVISAISISVNKYFLIDDDSSLLHASVAWNIMLLIAGAIEFIMAIVSSAMVCYFLCNNSEDDTVDLLQIDQQPYPEDQAMAPVTTNPSPNQSQAPGQYAASPEYQYDVLLR